MSMIVLSHLSPGYLILGLVLCALHGATVEEHPEAIIGAECGSMGSVCGHVEWPMLQCCSVSYTVWGARC